MSHDRTTPLDRIEEGETVELVGFRANGPSSLRLAELGLNPHTKITVLKSAHGQPLIICVRGSRLAIDRQTAHQIRVRPVSARPQHVIHERPQRGRVARGRRRRRFKDMLRTAFLGRSGSGGLGRRVGRGEKNASD